MKMKIIYVGHDGRVKNRTVEKQVPQDFILEMFKGYNNLIVQDPSNIEIYNRDLFLKDLKIDNISYIKEYNEILFDMREVLISKLCKKLSDLQQISTQAEKR